MYPSDALFVCRLQCQPSPPKESFFNTYKELITDYIWEDNQNRISYAKLIGSYEDGGLKLVDLEMKNKSLKLGWVKRLLNSRTTWRTFAHNLLPIKSDLWWKCKISKKDCKKKIKPGTYFWKDVILSWAELNFDPNDSPNVLLKSPIWYNSNLTLLDVDNYYTDKGII